MGLQKIKYLLLLILISGCSSTTDQSQAPIINQDLAETYAIEPQEDGGFSSVNNVLKQTYTPVQSGFMLLENNEDALHWRLVMADHAKHTLDLQYYLWYPEDSGRILLKHVLLAADRGVRVRMIVDDLLMIDKDHIMSMLAMHPNFEIRLFNPWQDRVNLGGRGLEFLQDMDRLNTRMHNKLMITDNQAVILGGRNIGDHYFGLADSYNFHDLDVLGIGPVAPQASEIFDHFWNSTWVMKPEAKDKAMTNEEFNKEKRTFQEKIRQSERLEQFSKEPQDWREELARLPEKLVPGTSRVIFDRLNSEKTVQTMFTPLWELLGAAENEVVIMNAYVIPQESGMKKLKEITDRGVKVRILTNSLESNDVPAVNSHYKAWRKPILKAGAKLYEIRADGEIQSSVVDTPPIKAGFMGLHSKAVVVDKQHVFIGSMNFDPRSININTEMGVIIDSPALGTELEQMISRIMEPQNSWQVTLDEDEDLLWTSSKGVETSQPARNAWQRVEDVFFMMFPKEYY